MLTNRTPEFPKGSVGKGKELTATQRGSRVPQGLAKIFRKLLGWIPQVGAAPGTGSPSPTQEQEKDEENHFPLHRHVGSSRLAATPRLEMLKTLVALPITTPTHCSKGSVTRTASRSSNPTLKPTTPPKGLRVGSQPLVLTTTRRSKRNSPSPD